GGARRHFDGDGSYPGSNEQGSGTGNGGGGGGYYGGYHDRSRGGGHGRRGGDGGKGGGEQFVPLYSGSVEPLKKSARGWAPTRSDSHEANIAKKIKGILDEMTREKFDRLAGQLLDIPVDSLETLRIIVGAVFHKAIDEPTFTDMYVDLCIRLNERSTPWPFVKPIYSEDTCLWRWTAMAGVETEEVLGPFESI
ncbi:unnamed protein product, partial [Scytosiphon promiscuus]